MEGNLSEWVQHHTSSKVTASFLKTLENLAKIHAHDSDKFTRACMALGKFKGEESFLRALHGRLQSRSLKSPSTTHSPHAEQSTHVDPILLAKNTRDRSRIKSKRVKLHYDDDGEEDPEGKTGLDLHLKPPRKGVNSAFRFKRISKEKAQKLKEFADVESDMNVSKKTHPAPFRQISAPNLVSYSDDEQSRLLDDRSLDEDVVPEDLSEDYKLIMDQDQLLSEERNWYDDDDDYGNPTAEVESSNMDFQPKLLKPRVSVSEDTDLKSQVHLSCITLNQRKSIIPPFIASYHDEAGELAIIGSMDGTRNTASSGIIDPVRNPESEFSLNAKRGSRMVMQKRLSEVRKMKAEDTANIQGTAIGNVLGVNHSEAKPQLQSDKDPKNAIKVTREEILASRKSLPAYRVRSQLLQVIRDNQVVVVIGETGSGKTTQLGQFLYEDGFCDDGFMVGCTQPRRVAAMSVAARVAMEMDVQLGDKVGYSIRFEDKTSPATKIKFMTDGILLRETLLDKMLDKYSCIIIDEAHERTLNTDVLLGIFKELLSRRRDLKLIITSATMNANKFSQFFGDAPQFTIPGRTFPVEIIYTRHPVSDYVESAVTQAAKIHLSTPISSGDILIFMTGQEDIEATCSGLREKLLDVYTKKNSHNDNNEPNDIEIIPIYSSLPADVQNKIFMLMNGKRKVVVATNIAETSLTVDGVKYVIDCGYAKLKVYNPQIGLDSLRITPISFASANQRSGRAGRTGPGVAYRLYTEDSAYEDMYLETIPEIQRTNLSNTLLLLKSFGVDDVMKFPFIDPPPRKTIMTSLFELWTIGALDNLGFLTKLGTLMASFPLQPSLSKILLISAQSGCSEEILTIVAMLSVPQVFYRPKERKEESDQARSRFFVPESDHLTLLNVYSQWKANAYSFHWCRRNFLQYKSLQRAHDIRRQLSRVMVKKNIPILSSGSDWDTVRKCICSGYAQQAAKLSGLSKYVHLKTGMELQLHPTSALFGAGDLPPYIVYHELLLTSKEYINVVTSVDPFWLVEYGILFYNVKRRVEETDEFDVDQPSHGIKDKLDLQIDACNTRKKDVLRKLATDRNRFEEMSSGSKTKKRGENDSSLAVSIGFKKRRPL
ncbi:LAFE_0F01288g1_1 [Lachancea fermentati]|uniref:Pre-mRNA-splicing factor ATP-dependent RNA helicase PRP16 n=1 Tax=Lachancea fermentati TaxID=4955 RepID=A0A1G4MEH0_LACFM|nr:LAFE_0F01288g1_1 [Lachancea fermentati]